MVSRNLERANENDGFKMTALEFVLNRNISIFAILVLTRLAFGRFFSRQSLLQDVLLVLYFQKFNARQDNKSCRFASLLTYLPF